MEAATQAREREKESKRLYDQKCQPVAEAETTYILFQPSSTGAEASGFHDASGQSIMSVTFIPERKCTPMSCSQVARPFSKGFVST